MLRPRAGGIAMKTYAKHRVEAITDAIYGFAMTLLIIDVRLPPGVHYAGAADLANALTALWPEFLAYLLNVLGGPLAVRCEQPRQHPT